MEHIQAPSFSLPDQFGTIRTLEDFRGQNILIYFYPKDMTPGCTIETIGFQDMQADFQKENTLIIGVSKDSVERHQKFCKKYDLNIILLSDENTNMIQKYGVWKEKSMFGKKYMGISRESFLIDTEGVIMHHWSKVKPLSHPQEVLSYLQGIQK